MLGRGTRRLLRVGFGCLEKLQRLAYNNAPAPVTSRTLRMTYSICSSFDSGNEEWNSHPRLSNAGHDRKTCWRRNRHAFSKRVATPFLAQLTFLPVLFDFGE